MVIEVGKFYKMKNDSMQEYGFAKGSPIFIVGSGFVPDSKTDAYKYRLVFVGAPVQDMHVKLEENGKPNGFTVDARNLSKVSKTVRSEEHTSELQSLMRISYAVFCLKKKILLYILSYLLQFISFKYL